MKFNDVHRYFCVAVDFYPFSYFFPNPKVEMEQLNILVEYREFVQNIFSKYVGLFVPNSNASEDDSKLLFLSFTSHCPRNVLKMLVLKKAEF